MSYTTARLALPLPDGGDGPEGPDVPYWFRQLGERLETTVVSFDKGFASARPRLAGQAGRVYFATDTGVLSFDDGREWRSTTGSSPVQVVGGGGPVFNPGYGSPQPTRPVRFWRDGSRVYLAGIIGGPATGNVFTLPDGFRPRYEQQMATGLGAVSASIAILGIQVLIRTTGVVAVAMYNNTTSTGGITLDGLSFDLER